MVARALLIFLRIHSRFLASPRRGRYRSQVFVPTVGALREAREASEAGGAMMPAVLHKATLGALALLVAGLVLPRALSAQSGSTVLQITNLSLNQTPDGILLVRAVNAPVQTLGGQVVATANVTSVVVHPTLEYLPTVIQATVGGATVVVSQLASRDGTFRRTYGFDDISGAPGFLNAGLLVTADEGVITLVVSRATAAPTPPTTLSHAFQFTQPRIDRLIGDTGLSFRPGNQWSLVPSPGQLISLGDNPSVSVINVTNPSELGGVNFLRLPDGQSGAVITCVGFPAVCGLAGVGDFNGLYGTAVSRTPASLGVSTNAASNTIVTHVDLSVPPNPPGCPTGALLPPPANLLARQFLGIHTELVWDSVECASGYAVSLRFADGGPRIFTVPGTTLADSSYPSSFLGGLVAFSVASIGQDGRRGPFSVEQPGIPAQPIP
jgi:hypothetical protein